MPGLLLLVAFALSGASGLVFELVWVRLLGYLLGGTTLAISTVLAAFMGGLALGSLLLGRRADGSASPLRFYALLEIGIASCAVAVTLLIATAQPAYVALSHLVPPVAMAPARTLLALAFLLPPTFLMGGTLPLLSRGLVHRRESLGRGLGSLYACNTLGAVAGAFLTGFVLIPRLGILPCVGWAAAGNLAAAGIALLVAGSRPAQPNAPEAAAKAKRSRRAVRQAPAAAATPAGPEVAPRFLYWAFALSGFAALGFELYWTRALHHFLGNSTYAFSAMLTTFLCGLALGGWAGGRLADRAVSPARWFAWTQIGIAVSAAATVPLLWNVLAHLEETQFFAAPQLGWSAYLLRRFLAAFAVMAVPTFLSGMAFPLASRVAVTSLARLGGGVGRLYAANTLGAIAGSLAAGFLLLPLLGARWALLGTALLSGAVGVALHAARRRKARGDAVLAAAVVLLVAAVAPALHRNARMLLSDTQSAGDEVLFDREDATADTRVYRRPDGELSMSVDGHLIGGTGPVLLRKEKVLAHLPVALVPRAERVLAVGLGSGITLGTLALYPEVRDMTCVEIVPGVRAAAAGFGPQNRHVLSDPRLRMVQGDGVQYLLTTPEMFDVISSDSKLNPEFVGNSTMLARDYYRLCREHLTPRGVMAQWMPVHVPASMNELVTRSFCAEFPYVELFWIAPNNLVMAGSRSPIVLDLDRWRERAADPAVRADLDSEGVADPYVLLTDRVAGREDLQAALGSGETNTWLRPSFEFRVLPEFRRKPLESHERDNLHWLAALQPREALRVSGAIDRARLARFQAGARQELLGYARSGRTDRPMEGRAEFEAGLARNPGDPRLVAALRGLNDPEGAPAAHGAPHNAAQWLEQGSRDLESGRSGDALASFERAIALDPGSSTAQYDRLIALHRLGRDDPAAIDRFTRDFPHDARGWSLLGRARAQAGDSDGALAALRKAIQTDPTTASYRNNLAVLFVRLGRFREAASAFAEAYGLDPLTPDAAYDAALAYSRAGLNRQAADWARTCLERNLASPARLLADPNLAGLRGSAEWKEVQQVMAARPPSDR